MRRATPASAATTYPRPSASLRRDRNRPRGRTSIFSSSLVYCAPTGLHFPWLLSRPRDVERTLVVNQPKRDDADAFDDLLGQLVDELAMTPTAEPEPEPEPEIVAEEVDPYSADAAAAQIPVQSSGGGLIKFGIIAVCATVLIGFVVMNMTGKPEAPPPAAPAKPGTAMASLGSGSPDAEKTPAAAPATATGPASVGAANPAGQAGEAAPDASGTGEGTPDAKADAKADDAAEDDEKSKPASSKRKSRSRRKARKTRRPKKRATKKKKKQRDSFDDL